MSEQMAARLAELRREYEVGQRRLQELVAQEVAVRETLLRISGAIQVLEELSSPTSAGRPVTTASGESAEAGGAEAGGAEAGTVLSVG